MAEPETVGVAEDTNVVGAPLPVEQADYRPMLEGFGPDKVVTVYNPLPNDFRFQHARSINQPAPLDADRKYAEEKAGISLRKDMNQGVSHYSQYWVLKAGESKNLPGDIAQKAVQDLVNYILMKRAGKGQPKNVADGYARAEVEKEVVLATSDNVTFMNATAPQDVISQTKQEVENLNPPAPVEAEQPQDPAPGQGVTYDAKSAKANK